MGSQRKYRLSNITISSKLIQQAVDAPIFSKEYAVAIAKELTNIDTNVAATEKAAAVELDNKTRAIDAEKASVETELAKATEEFDTLNKALQECDSPDAKHPLQEKLEAAENRKAAAEAKERELGVAKTNLMLQNLQALEARSSAKQELMDRSRDAVNAVADGLWLVALSEGVLGMNDHVGRARLFLSWIAYSFYYSEDILIGKKPEDTRPRFMEMLSTGSGVCANYSDLFVAMFNFIIEKYHEKLKVDPAKFLAGNIRGHSKKSRRSQQPNASNAFGTTRTVANNGHQWACFPFLSPSGSIQMKTVDPLWCQAGSTSLELVDATWFTNSEMAFQTLHVPQYEREFHGPRGANISWEDFRNALWTQDLPPLTRFEKVINLDIASLRPPTAVLPTFLAKKFVFSLDCPHGGRSLNRPAFLNIRPSKGFDGYFQFTPYPDNMYAVNVPLAIPALEMADYAVAALVVPYHTRASDSKSRSTRIKVCGVDVSDIDLDRPISGEEINARNWTKYVWKTVTEWEMGKRPAEAKFGPTVWLSNIANLFSKK